MVIYSITNRAYTPWGKRYNLFHWRASWWVYISLAERERKTLPFKADKPVNHILYWFDTNILQRIGKDTKFTLDVRIRIVCGMVNKLSSNRISIAMKREFMECIWDAYQKFSKDYMEYHCRYELGLPF